MHKSRLGLAAWAVLLCAGAEPADEDKPNFGDDVQVKVLLDSRSPTGGQHGYAAYPIAVINHSTSRTHKVTLSLPHDNYHFGGDVLRTVSRTVEVAPGERVRGDLLHPLSPPVQGENLRVSVDGRSFDRGLPLTLVRTGGVRYTVSAGRVIGMSSSRGGSEAVVLVSPNVPSEFLQRICTEGNPFLGHVHKIMVSGLARAEGPMAQWSTRWLSYSRFEGVVVSGDEVATAPAGVQQALWQYVETGGTLLILGQAPRLPASWSRVPPINQQGLLDYSASFGHCLVSADANYAAWPDHRWFALGSSWSETNAPWQTVITAADANRLFRVVDEVGVPVRGLFVLMVLFCIGIGPVNLWILGRKDRRIWMLWTVPAISLLTCLAVFGYMLISEGWHGHLRTESVTLLDETSHRATTFGWTAFYAPLTPGDGLHFSPDTEVMWQRGQDMYRRETSSASCTLDWSQDQHLASGWITARVPSHFKVRKSETTHLGLKVRHTGEGSLLVLNGLGSDLSSLWLADEKGRVWKAEKVPAGSQVALTLQKDTQVSARPTPMGELLKSTAWLIPSAPLPGKGGSASEIPRPMSPMMKAATPKVDMKPPAVPPPLAGPVIRGPIDPATNPLGFLTPLSYIAVLDEAPFVEDGLRNARNRKCRSIVLGMMKEPDDAN
jgi:hypothetical protein